MLVVMDIFPNDLKKYGHKMYYADLSDRGFSAAGINGKKVYDTIIYWL